MSKRGRQKTHRNRYYNRSRDWSNRLLVRDHTARNGRSILKAGKDEGMDFPAVSRGND
jgi:hypothetical protein